MDESYYRLEIIAHLCGRVLGHGETHNLEFSLDRVNHSLEFSAEQAATRLPILEDSKQIWSLLAPTRWNEASMDVGHDDETSCLSILFAPTWDIEHGLEITFYKDMIGIESSGTNWADQDHYDLEGNELDSE